MSLSLYTLKLLVSSPKVVENGLFINNLLIFIFWNLLDLKAKLLSLAKQSYLTSIVFVDSKPSPDALITMLESPLGLITAIVTP